MLRNGSCPQPCPPIRCRCSHEWFAEAREQQGAAAIPTRWWSRPRRPTAGPRRASCCCKRLVAGSRLRRSSSRTTTAARAVELARQPARRGRAALGRAWAGRCASRAASCDRPPPRATSYFASRALDSRIGAWASLQSQPLDSRTTLLKRVAAEAARHGTQVPRPPHWGGYRLWPEAVELWIEGAFRVHDRARWTRSARCRRRRTGSRPGPGPRRGSTPDPWPQRNLSRHAASRAAAGGAGLRRARRVARPPRSTDWDDTLRVTVYPVAADGDRRGHATATRAVDATAFDDAEASSPTRRASYGVRSTSRSAFRVSHAAHDPPPALPADPGPVSIALWSLQPALLGWRVAAERSAADARTSRSSRSITSRDGGQAAPDSIGLQQGTRSPSRTSSPAATPSAATRWCWRTSCCTRSARPTSTTSQTGQPLAPDGLGDPEQSPLYPQPTGEIMAGRIATAPNAAVIPAQPGRR